MNRQNPATESGRPRHPIAVVAERTGLSQDTLRMWERRYGAVTPVRSPGGQRLYSDDDVDRLRMLEAAIAAGRRVSHVARLPDAELARLVDEDRAAEERRAPVEPAHLERAGPPMASVDEAFERVLAMDARGLDELLRRAATSSGVPPTLENLVVPLLRKTGDEWHRGRLSIAAEHLASAVIESFLFGTMRTIPVPAGAPVLLTATPVGSRHFIAAAIAAALAAGDGWNVLFLGGDLPAPDIARAAIAGRARAVAVSAIYAADSAQLLVELRTLRELLPADVPLLAGGAAVRTLASELQREGIAEVGESLAELRFRLRALSAPASGS